MVIENQTWQILTLSHQAQFIITPNLTWWAIHTTVGILCPGIKWSGFVELKEILKLSIYKMFSMSASSSHPIFKIWVTLGIASKGTFCFNTGDGSRGKQVLTGQPGEWGLSGWQSCLLTTSFLSSGQWKGQNFQDNDWVRNRTEWQPEKGHERSSEAEVSWILMR